MAYSSKVKQLYCIYLIKCCPRMNTTLDQTPQMEAKLSINAALK